MPGEKEDIGYRAYRVVGRVQGVGFRWWTRDTAARLGLAGTVRNLPDGSVEVHASGREVDLETLEAALAEGPPASRVESVEVVALMAGRPRGAFRILH